MPIRLTGVEIVKSSVAIAFLTLAILSGCIRVEHPSDQQMVQEFQDHRPAFEMLLKMFRQETRVTRIGDGFIWIDGAGSVDTFERAKYLPDGRLAEYRKLFKELHLKDGLVRREDGSIAFLRSGRGIVPSGSQKDFSWAPQPYRDALAESDKRELVEACVWEGDNCSVSKKIAPNWYIEFHSN